VLAGVWRGSALSITWPGRLILYGSLGGATDDSELVSAILSGWGFRPWHTAPEHKVSTANCRSAQCNFAKVRECSCRQHCKAHGVRPACRT